MNLEISNSQTKKNEAFFIACAIAITMCFVLSFFYSECYAALSSDGKSVLQTLQKLELNKQTSFASGVLREMGYGIVKFLGTAVDYLANGVQKIYKLLTFSTSSQITNLVSRYSTLYKAIFILSVTALGLYLLLFKKGNQLNTVNCLLIMAVVIMAMPMLTSRLTTMTVNSASYAQNNWTSSSSFDTYAGTIVKENIVDLEKSGVGGLSKAKGYNNISAKNDTSVKNCWRNLDITAILDYKDADDPDDWWQYELDPDQDKYTKLERGFLGLGASYYYRYQVVSWFSIIGSLLVLLVVFLFACVKCAKLIIEVAMAEIYMPFIAITDIASGQRIKEAVRHFITLFFSIFLCVALLGVYFAGYSYINGLSYNWFLKLILQIALAWAIIDGPNIIERIFGVDIGIRSGWQMMMGARAAGGMAKGAAAGAAAGASTVAKGASKAGKGVGRVVAGKSGMEDAKKAADNAKQKAGDKVSNVTGGKGMVGAGQKAAGAAKGAMAKGVASEHSTESLNKTAAAAQANANRTATSASRDMNRDANKARAAAGTAGTRVPPATRTGSGGKSGSTSTSAGAGSVIPPASNISSGGGNSYTPSNSSGGTAGSGKSENKRTDSYGRRRSVIPPSQGNKNNFPKK